MKKLQVSVILLLLSIFPATAVMAAEGVIDVMSTLTVEKTSDRLEQILNQKGMTIFSRIHHSKSAAKVGIELRDTELFIFGNPKVGSPLMQCQQSVAIDLPQKALVWKDESGQVWISYNSPEYLQQRHAITGCEEVLAKIGNALAGIAKAAAMQ